MLSVAIKKSFMKASTKIVLFCISSFIFISCDRVTKDLAKEHLQNKPSISYLHNALQLVYVENTGAAMSMGDNLPKTVSFWLLSILPLLFLLFLAGYTIKHVNEMSMRKIFSFALLVAGGLGNIIDRIVFDRHVTDFMILSISKLQTGVFNFADVCVTSGAIGLMLFYRDKKQAYTNSQ
jgi:signal peptidase II